MTISLSKDEALFQRLRTQRLLPQSPGAITSVAQVVKDVCGIQAQESQAAALAIRVRSAGLVAADVEYAKVQARSVVRTWGLRGTLHLLAAEDLGWLLPLVGPVFITAGRRRRAELGLDEDLCRRAMRIMRKLLANQGPLTRAELVEQLASHDIRLEGQAKPHLLGRAALEGIICLGPDRGSEPTYVLLDDWIDQEYRGQPLSEDIAFLLGNENRDLCVPRQYSKRINAGGGIVHPSLLVDGCVVGTWKSTRQKNFLDVMVEPFDQLAPEVQTGLEHEIADLTRFLF